jgi:hypothetical protein
MKDITFRQKIIKDVLFQNFINKKLKTRFHCREDDSSENMKELLNQ